MANWMPQRYLKMNIWALKYRSIQKSLVCFWKSSLPTCQEALASCSYRCILKVHNGICYTYLKFSGIWKASSFSNLWYILVFHLVLDSDALSVAHWKSECSTLEIMWAKLHILICKLIFLFPFFRLETK